MENEHFKIDFNNVSSKLQIELSYFKEYIVFNCEKLNERKDKLNSLMLQETTESPENKLIIEQIYFEEKLKLPSYYYHSTIVSLFSLLENNLNEICAIIINETDFAFSLDDLADKNLIKKARLFLTRIANLDFAKIDTLWIEITTIQKLRNLIVHNNSQLKQDNISEEVKKLILKFGLILQNKTNLPFYIDNNDLLPKFLLTIELFFYEILTQLKEMKFLKFAKAYKIEELYGEIPF